MLYILSLHASYIKPVYMVWLAGIQVFVRKNTHFWAAPRVIPAKREARNVAQLCWSSRAASFPPYYALGGANSTEYTISIAK